MNSYTLQLLIIGYKGIAKNPVRGSMRVLMRSSLRCLWPRRAFSHKLCCLPDSLHLLCSGKRSMYLSRFGTHQMQSCKDSLLLDLSDRSNLLASGLQTHRTRSQASVALLGRRLTPDTLQSCREVATEYPGPLPLLSERRIKDQMRLLLVDVL